MNLLFFLPFAWVVVSCTRSLPRELAQWKQRKGLQLAIHSSATHSIKPTLVVEVGQDGIWVEERLWSLQFPPKIRKMVGSTLKRYRLPTTITKGKLSTTEQHHKESKGYLLPKLHSYAKRFSRYERKQHQDHQNFRFQGDVTLYLDRDIPYKTLVKVMFTLGQAMYGTFYIAVCTQPSTNHRCKTKAFRVSSPKFGGTYHNAPTLFVARKGFQLGEGGLSVSGTHRPKHIIPKEQGKYNYKALTMYLAQRKKHQNKQRAEKLQKQQAKHKGKAPLSLLQPRHLLGSDVLFVSVQDDMPIHSLFPVFAATQRTPQGKELYPYRILFLAPRH